MKIQYLGHSCFYLESKTGVSLLTDPYTKVGYELPSGIQADIVLTSHEHFDHNNVQAVSTECTINKSGEKDCFGIKIKGIDSFHDPLMGRLRGNNVIFKFDIDGIIFCHLGDLGEPCSTELLEKIGKVDVLLIPIGGTYTIDAAQAYEYAQKIAPKVVIPMHYKPLDGALDISSADEFLSFYNEKQIRHIRKGEHALSLDKLTEETLILYMERVKA